jgi:hypothetical protein
MRELSNFRPDYVVQSGDHEERCRDAHRVIRNAMAIARVFRNDTAGGPPGGSASSGVGVWPPSALAGPAAPLPAIAPLPAHMVARAAIEGTLAAHRNAGAAIADPTTTR